MDKLRLDWTGHDANIRDYFRKLKDDQRLFDVTLVTDDGQHLQAHKMILSAGSNFFSDIFNIRPYHSNMLVYLKGISYTKLEPVIDFIYNGEAFIAKEELRVFIETGKDLQVKGLEGDLTKAEDNSTENLKSDQETVHGYDYYNSSKDENEVSCSVDDKSIKEEEEKLQLMTSLNEKEMVEKKEGVWTCKVCGKTATTGQNIQSHAEIHIGGRSHACHVCSKTFSTRHTVNSHVSNVHSELFSCDICEKTGMSRGAYRKHRRVNHK